MRGLSLVLFRHGSVFSMLIIVQVFTVSRLQGLDVSEKSATLGRSSLVRKLNYAQRVVYLPCLAYPLNKQGGTVAYENC